MAVNPLSRREVIKFGAFTTVGGVLTPGISLAQAIVTDTRGLTFLQVMGYHNMDYLRFDCIIQSNLSNLILSNLIIIRNLSNLIKTLVPSGPILL